MENIKEILGKRIREERKKKGLSIEELAEMVDLCPSSLGLVERANRSLSIEKLYSVAKALEVTIDTLFKDYDELLESRVETIQTMVSNLSNNEFEFVTDIISTMKNNFKK